MKEDFFHLLLWFFSYIFDIDSRKLTYATPVSHASVLWYLNDTTETIKHYTASCVSMAIKCEIVPGKKKTHHVKIFTLSTCGWCKKTKELLKALEIQYEYLDVDRLTGADLLEVDEEIRRYNPSRTYPTIVIDNGKSVILGFNDKEIKGKLNT
jgi:glutaredoxin-like protein NrdH